jgi:uncharacterized protein (DUF58 family)
MIDIDFLKQLDKFDLVINKKIISNFIGERETPHAGRGLVFKDRNFYVPGDDFRAIDWKAYGRTGKLFIKRYEEDRNMTVHVLVDYSGSMNFGKVKKSDYAAMLGMGFSYMAMKKNERFVLGTFSDVLDQFKPKKGKRQLVALLDYLNERKPSGKTEILHALAKYRTRVRGRSYVVIISDFLYDLNEIETVLGMFKNHEVVAIQVLDPLERDLSLTGDFEFSDLETDDQMKTYVGPSLRNHYTKMLKEHNARLLETCDKLKVKFNSVSTDESIFDVFYKVLG